MTWQRSNVLVTGATGLLGPWLIEELVKNGDRVTALVRDQLGQSRFFSEKLDQKVSWVYGDLVDQKLLERILLEQEIEVVYHLGAQALVGVALRDPHATFESNIRGTYNLLEAVRKAPHVKSVVVASSDKAYGQADVLPYTEQTPLNGRFPYDASKACTDILAQSYAHTYNLPIVITRCGNFFGGGDHHYNRIIPGTIKSILQDQHPIIRSNGLLVRDYIYVKDVVSGYTTLAQQQLAGAITPGEAFNISTDTPFNVIDIVTLILDIMDCVHLQPIILHQPVQEILAQHLSSQKIHERFGWYAHYGVRAGIKETVAWYRAYVGAPKITHHRVGKIDCGVL